MDAPFSATPADRFTEGSPPLQDVNELVTKGVTTGDGAVAALIGGTVGAMLVLIVVTLALLLWCLSRQKGSYATNEADGADIDEDDEESVGSDAALQRREPEEMKEE